MCCHGYLSRNVFCKVSRNSWAKMATYRYLKFGPFGLLAFLKKSPPPTPHLSYTVLETNRQYVSRCTTNHDICISLAQIHWATSKIMQQSLNIMFSMEQSSRRPCFNPSTSMTKAYRIWLKHSGSSQTTQHFTSDGFKHLVLHCSQFGKFRLVIPFLDLFMDICPLIVMQMAMFDHLFEQFRC